MMSHPHVAATCLTDGLEGSKSDVLQGLGARLLSGHKEVPVAYSTRTQWSGLSRPLRVVGWFVQV